MMDDIIRSTLLNFAASPVITHWLVDRLAPRLRAPVPTLTAFERASCRYTDTPATRVRATGLCASSYARRHQLADDPSPILRTSGYPRRLHPEDLTGVQAKHRQRLDVDLSALQVDDNVDGRYDGIGHHDRGSARFCPWGAPTAYGLGIL